MMKFIGLLLILVGVTSLIVSFIAGWTDSNAVLFAGLFLVLAGVVWHIVAMKKESKY